MELTRRLLTSLPTLPSGPARSRAVVKIVILFVAEMAARPRRTKWTKALLFTCWNADGVHGRKQELDHFLGQHGIDICLLNKTHLRSGEVFRLTYYVCHRNDRLTEGGGAAILVRRVIDHHNVPVQGLQHLDLTAIHVMFASKPAKILAAYLSHTRLLIASDLSACLGGDLPLLMAGDLNAKHVEWNSRLITKEADACVTILIRIHA